MTGAPPDAIWVPDDHDMEHANVTAFARFATENAGYEGDSYNDLWRWSVDRIGEFWGAVWDFYGVQSSTPYDRVHSGAMPNTVWFNGAQLNYVDAVFRNRPADGVALVDLIEAPDARPVRRMTWSQLQNAVASFADELRAHGVRRGHRVVAYVPNAAEAVVAFLATASLGAIWSACGQDYSPSAAAQRFSQLTPRILIAADGYLYGGREHDRRAAVEELRAALPTLRATIVFSRLPGSRPWPSDVVEWPRTRAGAELHTVAVPFDHPLWVLFSSGTTGRPKGLVHSTGGVLLEHLKAMGLGLNLGATDTYFWYTSPSWMVWNYLVAGLLVGSRIICFDGSPTHPSEDTLWRIAADEGVTLLGTSPSHLQACMAANLKPAQSHDLSALRSLGSSGSALPAAAYHYVKEHVGARVRVNSTSGGTDVVSSFAGSPPTVPVWPGELSAPSLGVALDSFDDAGRPIRDEVGELVITKPMPSMPLELWNDPGGERYRSTYFADYPGVWRHGDWITIRKDRGSVIVHGRSDATLNKNGVRFGSSEIYRALDTVPEVAESLVVGIERPGGEYWMPLFVELTDGATLDDSLTSSIVRVIREVSSPRHVPSEVIEVAAVPHTLTGKKLEIPVKRILLGEHPADVVDLGAVDRPDVLMSMAELAVGRTAL